MLKLSNIKIPARLGLSALPGKICETLDIPAQELKDYKLLKLSIDSRKKPEIYYIATVSVSLEREDAVLKKGLKPVSPYLPQIYQFPLTHCKTDVRPVIVGSGPAGLFAALSLAEAGIPCTILERGNPVEQRFEDVNRFWSDGALDESSNVQFGEGGAGTFSDGKLTTGIRDRRIGFVLEQFVRFGAPEDILYLAKPHIGTDNLRKIVRKMRLHLEALGCDIRFRHQLTDVRVNGDKLAGIEVLSPEGNYTLETNHLILCPGNSARDTFRMLYGRGAAMEPKSFSVGVRLEHRQADIDMAQYGSAATLGTLPAADYKLAVHLKDGRSVYTFCVCPGGSVVAAASKRGTVVTNGMSQYARAGENINGGLLVSVTPEDFGGTLFGGMEFQEKLEHAAFIHGGENYHAPAQRVSDFMAKRPSDGCGQVVPSYAPGVRYCNLWDVLPDFVCRALFEALPEMERKIRGFSNGDAVMTAVETRSSSPVRILRGEDFQSSIKGIFPCGEGAGFAGGITSSAVDGIRCAEAVAFDLLRD